MARDARVDEQIGSAPVFARPVLQHLRELVHTACPEIEETIKWGRPFFQYRGTIVFYMAAFKQHCGFGFVGAPMKELMVAAGMPVDDASGSLGRITGLKDLPPDRKLLGWMRQALHFAETGEKPMRRAPKAPRPEIEMPEEFGAALGKHKAAGENFEDFSPSCRREYIEWIAEAKRPETRQKRVAQAVEWIGEGKSRNWKYEAR